MSRPDSSSQPPQFRIFLSHAGEDKETIARPLFKQLEQYGLSVFLDEESFRLGDHCPEIMEHAMQTAPVGVFIMSPEFVAKEWPMRELLAFVRRYDHAKQHKQQAPLLIPIFYRFSTNECRNPVIFNTYSALFYQHGLYGRACNGTVTLQDVMHALDMAAKMWSIRNDVGATNSDKPGMSRTREAFIEIIETALRGKLGIENGASSQEVHRTVAQTQSAQEGRYTSKNMVPQNPPRLTLNYESLTTCEGQLMNAVLRKGESRVVAVLATGKGGVGKTCALRGLAEEREIKREFSGGILYMELGNDATIRNVIEGIANIVKRTGGAKLAKLIATLETVGEASLEASEWFGKRRCLFLVDDIWHVNGIDSDVLDDMGRMVGTKSRMVYTTRDRYFVHDATEWIEFKEKEPHGELSRQMLMTHAGFDRDLVLEDKNEEAVKHFLTLCQGLPLGFGIIGRSVREYSLDCKPRENGWAEFHNAVISSRGNLMKTKAKSYGTIPKIVESSLVVLEKRSGHDKHGYWFRGLSVVQKQQSVPAEMLQKLWNLGSLEETKGVVKSFAEVSVLEMRRKRGSMFVRLHDLILDVAIHQAGEKNETKSFYQALVHNYMKCGGGKQRDELHKCATTASDWEMCCRWWKVRDDGYIRNNVCRLLRNAGYVDQLLWLLSQPQWIVSRLVEDGILSVEQDLEHGRAVCHTTTSEHRDREEHLQMISRAGRMSALFVNKNARAEEGWFQLHGRLQWHATQNELTKEFLEKMEKCAPRPWLKASAGLLLQAGSSGTQAVNVSGMVLCTHEERNVIWIFSEDSIMDVMHVGKYDKENESHREVALQMDEWSHVVCASFLRDLRAVTAHEDGRIRVWNTTTGVCEKIVQRTDEAHTSFVNFTDRGTVIASQSDDYSVELRNALSGELMVPVLRGHTGRVTCVAVSGDGTRIVSGSNDKTVRVWDAQTGSAVGQPLQGHTFWVTCVAVSADGSRIVSGSWDKTVRVWSAHTCSAVGQPLRGHTGWVRCVAVNADGTRILSGSHDHTVRVWDAHTGSAVGHPLEGHTGLVRCVGVSGDGTRIVSGSDDKTMRVWSAHTGSAVRHPLEGHALPVTCVGVSADGTRIVSGSVDETVRVWNAHTGSAVGEPLRGHTRSVRCVGVSASGARIVSGSNDKTVRVWDAHTGSAVGHPLEGHTDWVRRVAVSADGTRIVSQDFEMLRLWEMNAQGAECVLTSRDAEWQRTIDALELAWSGTERVFRREVRDVAEGGSEIVLGSCEQDVFNVGGGDVYFTKYMKSSCRILR